MSRAMLTRFVPENIQSITQGFRNVLFEMAILCVILPVTYLSQTMFAMLVIVCVSLVWYIAEEYSYRNVQVIGVNYEIISRRYVNETKI